MVVESRRMAIEYPHFWKVVFDFQTLISAGLGLTAVVGAIYGIKLQAYLTERAAARQKREAKKATAGMIRSLIMAEEKLGKASLLQVPSEKHIFRMLNVGSSIDFKPSDYVSYLAKMASQLAEFPAPISERASFLSWASGRVVLATAMAQASSQDSSEMAAVAQSTRNLLIVAIRVIEDLRFELANYVKNPELYEANWKRKPHEAEFHGSVQSRAFNLEQLELAVWVQGYADQWALLKEKYEERAAAKEAGN